MAELVTVTALTPLTYRGRSIEPNESFEVKPIEALALTYRKKAIFAKPLARYRTAEVTPEPETPAEPTRTKRQYRRRDLQAEE